MDQTPSTGRRDSVHLCSLVCVSPRDSRRRGKHCTSSVCTAKLVGPRSNTMFISSHRQSCGHNTFANILLDAEVKDEEEDEDPGEARQTHHVAWLYSFPERAPGVVRQPRRVTSHSSFPSPAYLQLDILRMAFFSARKPLSMSTNGDDPDTFEGARGQVILLASLLPSWSNPRKVRRRTLEFTSKMPVTMKQAPSRRTRGRKTPNSFRTVPGSSLASLLPSSSSRHCPQVVGPRTREFSSTSGHSRH